jgi:hypothetical protein
MNQNASDSYWDDSRLDQCNWTITNIQSVLETNLFAGVAVVF